MSVKIIGTLFDDACENGVPHGIRCGNCDAPISRPIDLTDLNEKDRVDKMRYEADRIGMRKNITVEWCVHRVEHTNTKGTMIIDPNNGKFGFRPNQNWYRFVPSHKAIDGGKILSVELHTIMYYESQHGDANGSFHDFWILRCLSAAGEYIKHFWVCPDDFLILNCIGGESYIYTNKQEIKKDYRNFLPPTKPVRIGIANVKMRIA